MMSSMHPSTNEMGSGEHLFCTTEQTVLTFPSLQEESGLAQCSSQWGPRAFPTARDQSAKSVAVSAVLEKEGGASVHPMVMTEGNQWIFAI